MAKHYSKSSHYKKVKVHVKGTSTRKGHKAIRYVKKAGK